MPIDGIVVTEYSANMKQNDLKYTFTFGLENLLAFKNALKVAAVNDFYISFP